MPKPSQSTPSHSFIMCSEMVKRKAFACFRNFAYPDFQQPLRSLARSIPFPLPHTCQERSRDRAEIRANERAREGIEIARNLQKMIKKSGEHARTCERAWCPSVQLPFFPPRCPSGAFTISEQMRFGILLLLTVALLPPPSFLPSFLPSFHPFCHRPTTPKRRTRFRCRGRDDGPPPPPRRLFLSEMVQS